MTDNYQKILSIDYGKANIGLAFTSSLIPEALNPIKVISLDDSINKVSAISQAIKPDLIIVGMPEGNLSKEIKKFSSLLSDKTHIKVINHPETLSTKDAVARLRSVGAKKSKFRKDHSFAACIILEDYLDINSPT